MMRWRAAGLLHRLAERFDPPAPESPPGPDAPPTPEELAFPPAYERAQHYRRDSAGDGVGTAYMGSEVDAWIDERFTVLAPPKTLAKVLVRR